MKFRLFVSLSYVFVCVCVCVCLFGLLVSFAFYFYHSEWTCRDIALHGHATGPMNIFIFRRLRRQRIHTWRQSSSHNKQPFWVHRIVTEQVNDFALSGIFEVEERHKELSICPRHRDDFGTRWLCNKKKMLLSIGLGSTWEVFSERWSRHDSATVSKALCFNIYASVPVGVPWVYIRIPSWPPPC